MLGGPNRTTSRPRTATTENELGWSKRTKQQLTATASLVNAVCNKHNCKECNDHAANSNSDNKCKSPFLWSSAFPFRLFLCRIRILVWYILHVTVRAGTAHRTLQHFIPTAIPCCEIEYWGLFGELRSFAKRVCMPTLFSLLLPTTKFSAECAPQSNFPDT